MSRGVDPVDLIVEVHMVSARDRLLNGQTDALQSTHMRRDELAAVQQRPTACTDWGIHQRVLSDGLLHVALQGAWGVIQKANIWRVLVLLRRHFDEHLDSTLGRGVPREGGGGLHGPERGCVDDTGSGFSPRGFEMTNKFRDQDAGGGDVEVNALRDGLRVKRSPSRPQRAQHAGIAEEKDATEITELLREYVTESRG
jgi:hypothetical protein